MKTIILLFFLIPVGIEFSNAQVILSGKITDSSRQPLPGANIMIKGSYDGASTDTAGNFKFKTMETGKQILVASFIGYKNAEREIDLSVTPVNLELALTEQSGELKEVTITAGAFETGELKKAIVLKPMDIATTPSAVGDIYGALTTLPGAQVVGNEGGLYVRGGEGYETKTFIDGMQVVNPYTSKMPDLPTRSRFSPILFTGTAFSTGGYTAEYGQALSSAINLNTTGLADKNQGTVSLMSVGMSGSYAHRWERTSLAGTIQYITMKPYYALFKQKMKWEKPPELVGSTMLFRQKYGKYGMLKIFSSFDQNKSALHYNYKGDSTGSSLIDLYNINFYINAVYKDRLSEKWRFKTGLAYTCDNNNTGIDVNRLRETVKAFHHRLTFTNDLNKQVSVKYGEEISWYSFERNYYLADSSANYYSGFRILDYAVYVEPEIRINNHFVARTGFRGEYVSLLNEWQFVPRISMAYNTGDYSQISLAYGLFRQRPDNQYIVNNPGLKSERATHLIVNYQYEADKRIFRLELYRKWYDKLVKYDSEYNPDPRTYSNMGSGYAQGVDLFWRDSKSVRDLDYWISYSYINTKRNYKNYQQLRVPSFISPHTLSVVVKYLFRKANTYTGLTYVHASPKTWYNPALQFTSGDQTRAYNDLSLNITSLRPFFGSYCAFLLNISNVLGFDNVFGYHYSSDPNQNGNFTLYPIKPQSKRFFIIGAYLIF